MCSEIDKRTRDNPEAAMVHSNQMRNYLESGLCQAKGSIWPWPTIDDIKNVNPTMTPFLESLEKKRQCPEGDRKDLPGFDSEAHRAFMRSLG